VPAAVVAPGEDRWQEQLLAFEPTICLLLEPLFQCDDGRGGRTSVEDARAFLDTEQVPYTGPPVAASAIASDKVETKDRAGAAGVPVIPSFVADAVADLAALPFDLPVIAKPLAAGGGMGVLLCRSHAALAEHTQWLTTTLGCALIEPFIV